MPPAASRTSSEFITAAGPLAAEERLLARCAELATEARADPRLLLRPVRIVVPSGSLHAHVCERLARVHGSSLGVSVQTLPMLAAEILRGSGNEARPADAWLDVLLRREARGEQALREVFDEFQDGYRSASATVRDLLDAGFEPALLDAGLEVLEGLRLPLDERTRAMACLRVACATAEALGASLGGSLGDSPGGPGGERLAGRAERLRLAREAFEADPDTHLPTRALVIHGFADATGRAAELLESLTRRLPTEVLMDRPGDPRTPQHADLGVEFCERLSLRLRGACSGEHQLPQGAAPSAPTMFRAPGASAEAREVALRIRDLLAAGAVPERIGVVARDLEPHAVAVRTQFQRLGIPFSGLAASAPLDGPGRRIHALLELLESRAECPVERWLDAALRLSGPDPEQDPGRDSGQSCRPGSLLRLGLRVLGASRLGELAALEPTPGKDVRLPLTTGSAVRSDTDPRSGRELVKAQLPARDLALAVAAAECLRLRLVEWPERASLAIHLARFGELRREDLGWSAQDEPEVRVRGALAELEVPATAELELWEVALLLRRALPPAAAQLLGGAGGGVQVLGVTEARARTFDQLFIVGLNRGSFPRVGSEDPLLSDDVRGALSAVLPDVPIKARSRYEERYLFAQLVAAAPAVTLSWQFSGEDGKARVVSPLVERLFDVGGEGGEGGHFTARAVVPLDPGEDLGDAPRTARESATLAGLREGVRGEFAAQAGRMALALGEGVESELAQGAEGVASARSRILAAFEIGSLEPERLAPWLGFLGPQADQELRPDPEHGDVFVTRLEEVARCPWQAVLRKFLALEHMPDPLESLPAIESLALGQVVHKTLQQLVEEAVAADEESLPGVLARQPVCVPWPETERLDALLLERARREVRAFDLAYPGFARAVAEYARPYVLRARELLGWDTATASVLGAEVLGVAHVELAPDRRLDVPFKADLVERREGELLLTDFKTGSAKRAGQLASTLLPRGEYLQSLTYAAAAAELDPDGVAGVGGRYLFLGPKIDAAHASVDAGPWVERLEDLAGAVRAVADGWSAGTFFPRLVDPSKDKEPSACSYCEVAQACLVGDSGARHALKEFTGSEGTAPPAFQALWELGQRKVAAPKKKKKGG